MVSLLKRYLPHRLFGRSVLIIITPLVLLQVVSTFVFYQSHWQKVSDRLADGVAGDIAAIVELMGQASDAETRNQLSQMFSATMGVTTRYIDGEILPSEPQRPTIIDSDLIESLHEVVAKPFKVDSESVDKNVIVSVQLSGGVVEVAVNRKRLFTSTTYIFVIWMVGTSLILFGVAAVFMRNQVRPIRRLAIAADQFGKGRDAPSFKPEGATEVRQAAAAFLAMRDRIQRQITQRTEMLAGVSHDLRTPLTRMKLQLEMLGKAKGVDHLKDDVAEMEKMVEAYLAFARGEGDEMPAPTDLSKVLDEVVGQARRKGAMIDLHTEGEIVVPVRPNAFKRCVMNLVENADRYAEHVSVRAGRRGETIEITVDDDGPGIPADKREEAFRPFYRIENSRNQATGGVGLGLTIARDVIRGHGGDIALMDSPAGGLRARLVLPI
jgi:two-component system osmolarity sensor histidine kinase EnvZ